MKKSVFKKGILLLIIFVFSLVAITSFVNKENESVSIDVDREEMLLTISKDESQVKNGNVIYLTDIDYVAGESYSKHKNILYDKIDGTSDITVKVNGSDVSFKKGIWAHAESKIVYDLSNYDYNYFTAYIGLNNTATKGDGVKFSIYTSQDGKNWGEAKYVENKTAGQNATLVKVDIKGAKYLQLFASQNANNAHDQAVYADAKLVKNIDTLYAVKSVEQYDEILKTKFANQTEISGEYELTLLQRELVSKAGQLAINSFYIESERNKEALDWLLNNLDVLRLYIYGGAPAGSYYNSLTQLSRLYYNYKDDFSNPTPINNKWVPDLTYGKLYTKMAITLSLTHSTRVSLWMWVTPAESQSDAVERYAIYKYMYNTGRFKAGANDYAPWFEALKVEEMRFIMNNSLDDESVLWLNDYVNTRIAANGGKVGNYLTPHPYISYVWPNYTNPIYFANENEAYFNELFAVNKTEANVGKELVNANGEPTGKVGLWDSEYRIPGGKENPEYSIKITRGTSNYKLAKVWMNFRNKFGTGAVCGGISKSGSNIRATHAIPATVIGQPAHAALLYYSRLADGRGSWGIDNDVSGWTLSEKGERLLLGWGNGSYRSRYNVVYMQLGQEALNDYDNLIEAEKLVKLASAYSGDLEKQEELYRKALSIQKINLDAWLGLIDVYNKSTSKTEDDYYDLAEEIAEGLKNFPLPMYDLTNLIKPKLKSIENDFKFTLLQARTLTYASKLQTSDEIVSPSLTRTEANYLLGKVDKSLAKFSFDGEDARKIILSSKYDGSGIRWDYSIDGKQTWNEVSFTGEEEHKHELTAEEIEKITAENDIYIHIVGVNYDEKNLFKIDILESAGLPATLFASDLENRLIAAPKTLEWKYKETDKWTPYGKAQPDLEGDKPVIVRAGATGVYLASKTSTTYVFTANNDPDTRKYIPVKHLSLVAVSTEATSNGGAAINALDANYNTRYHSAWNGSDTQRYITVKLDEPVYLSAVEFVPAAGGNGKIYDGTIYGSMDGEKWQVLKQVKNLTYKNSADTVAQAIDNIKSFDLDDPTKVQYVKIVADRTNGNWFTARAFNFYQDTTAKAVADFSFDGENAGSIVLFEENYGKSYKYSIDGGTTWIKVSKDIYKLSSDELEKISPENHIKVKIDGDTKEYVIKIRKGTAPALGYLNDLENRPLRLTNTNKLEWKISGSKKWTSYSDAEPYVEGNNTLLVRTKATGRYQASDATEYVFTDDNQTDDMKYISIKHESIDSYSTQSIDSGRPYYAPNIIDGDPETLWHTDFRYDVRQQNVKPYVTIKLDDARYISALEFVQKKYKVNDPDYIKTAIVYVSEDGEHWKEAGRLENCPQNIEMRQIKFDKSIYGQYVKLEMETYDIFASLATVNLYEDTTKKLPAESIEYSIKNPTNKDVVATIISDDKITITNNDGKNTHTFTENGTFTFEYTTKGGNKKSMTAIVDWIDKEAPVGTIKYSVPDTDVTNQDVVVTLETNEPVTITNNGGKNTYTFKENGEFTFEFTDKVGNKGTAVAAVSNINKKTPTARIKYSTTALTNQDVIATIEVADDVTIRNNGGSKEYTFTKNGEFSFEFVDRAGNMGTITAKVNNIDKTAPTAKVNYSITKATNKDVVATLVGESETITVTNNNGKSSYTFTKNGEFTFEFVDKVGNKGSVKAEVNYIDKDAPKGTITYSKTTPTKDGVIATLTTDEDVTITNNDGKNTYVFKENGEFKFEFTDKVGNKGTAIAKVTWISKDAPIGTVTYSIDKATNKDVIATLNVKDGIKVTNNNGSKTYTFTKNGTFKFEFEDSLGNKGAAIATVDWIDKEAPIAMVNFNISTLTNKDVVATISFDEKDAVITNNNHKNTYTFTKNGEFTFEFEDALGNKGSKKVSVNWIDKTAPVATITYDKSTPTNSDVIVTIKFNEENVVINNNDKKTTYTFTKNGEFTFEFTDMAGNKGTAKASVNWIDKEAPVGKISYSINEMTNKDVIATISFDEEVNITSKTHTFTKNGEFTFEFTDKVGNKGTAVAKVDWIDKEAPIGKISYSENKLTNKDVIATISFDEEVNITSKTHTFTKNGEFTFEFTDKLGNKGTAIAKVDWIDKEAPIATFTYSTTDITNGDVIATIKFNEEDVTILNNGGKNTYTFTENDEFTFEFTDKVGNKGTATVKVNWINKNAPIGTITYSHKELTNKDVIATLTVKEGVKVTNNNGSKTHTFTDNGVFTFEFEDNAGNKGTATAKVDWIDKKAPIGEVTYNINSLTNKNVVATIKFNEEDVTITNNDGKNTYTFTENSEFTFEFTDKAGNKGKKTVKVDWIDKKVAKATVKYSINELTNQSVIATVTFDKEDVVIKNNNASNTYTFTKNGEFTFEYIDKSGNEGTVKASVNWINKVIPECSVDYNIKKLTNQDVVATIKFKDSDITITNNKGSNSHTFTENGEFTFEFTDKAGNKGEYTVKVDWIDKVVATAKIIYSTTNETANDVIATITSDEEIFVINNNGKKTYTFKENGEFEFDYEDSLGNKGKLLAKVEWIKKNNNPVKPEETNKPNNNIPATKPVDRPIISSNSSTNNNSYETGNTTSNDTSSNTSKDNDIIDVVDSEDLDEEEENIKLELRKYLDDDKKANTNSFMIILIVLAIIFVALSFIYGLLLKRDDDK